MSVERRRFPPAPGDASTKPIRTTSFAIATRHSLRTHRLQLRPRAPQGILQRYPSGQRCTAEEMSPNPGRDCLGSFRSTQHVESAAMYFAVKFVFDVVINTIWLLLFHAIFLGLRLRAADFTYRRHHEGKRV
jgi:hypothetical protein